MADLSANVVLGYGRNVIMPPNPTLLVNHPGEIARVVETLSRARTLEATPTEALRAIANFVTTIRGTTGQVAFNANPSHATLISYTARVRVSGNSTVVATQGLGKPTPDGNNVIIVDMSATFAGLAAGNYTVSILATDATGSTDSAESSPFSLPLA